MALGNGDGTFQGFISTSPTRVAVAAVGDFNGDGKADLVTPLQGILLGNGDGTFQTPIAYPAGIVNSGATVMAVADFNGDGNADLATTDGIALGNGDGTFQAEIDYPLVGNPAVAVGDFNGDGKLDVASLHHRPQVLVTPR